MANPDRSLGRAPIRHTTATIQHHPIMQEPIPTSDLPLFSAHPLFVFFPLRSILKEVNSFKNILGETNGK
jgi:hypothetical protein